MYWQCNINSYWLQARRLELISVSGQSAVTYVLSHMSYVICQVWCHMLPVISAGLRLSFQLHRHHMSRTVASLGRERTALGDTLQRGDTGKKKKLWLNLQRIVDKRGRAGKKGAGWHPLGGDTRVKWIKATAITKKGRQFFRRK